MTTKEHKAYLKKFKAYSREVLSTKENALQFLINAGINTPTGRLTKAYKDQSISNKVK